MRILILVLLLSGCAMTFQPFQPISREEFKQVQDNILILAQELNKLKVDEKK